MPKTFREFLNEARQQEDVLELGRHDQLAHAKRGRHLDKLMHSPHRDVRAAVALHGTHKHRDHLMHDEDADVRSTVAFHGTHKHRDHQHARQGFIGSAKRRRGRKP